MIITRLRLIIGVLTLVGAGIWLWNIHDALAQRRVQTAIHRLHVEQQRQEAERLRIARKHQIEIAALRKENRDLKAEINVEDDPHCDWDADIVRVLNAARGHGPAGQSVGPLPAPARIARAPGPK